MLRTGRAEREFTDAQCIIRFIYVDPKFLNNSADERNGDISTTIRILGGS